ncbi:hypothetical protein NBRC116590_15890 [Pelagimonas sp. KU-00592-HH]|jgi:hypothetical protein|nr:hypothetical protein [Shimia sp. CNT1-13L.2]MCP9483757.1 hypothetical protein [Shimia sp. CNT1-13L.2]
MRKNARFTQSIVAAAKQDVPAMPWARGARRAAFIAKRKGLDLIEEKQAA